MNGRLLNISSVHTYGVRQIHVFAGQCTSKTLIILIIEQLGRKQYQKKRYLMGQKLCSCFFEYILFNSRPSQTQLWHTVFCVKLKVTTVKANTTTKLVLGPLSIARGKKMQVRIQCYAMMLYRVSNEFMDDFANTGRLIKN